LTNYDLQYYSKQLNIPHFRGVYMRDTLPGKPKRFESAIVNLDDNRGNGTHWVCYKKHNDTVFYFDSFGNLSPPAEIIRYLGPDVNIKYNYDRKQSFDSVICGHLCLDFLTNV
jgi:hypothetical protein